MTREPDPLEHDWFAHLRRQLVVCRRCGIVQRADRKNKPCKGPTKLRPMEPIQTDDPLSGCWTACDHCPRSGFDMACKDCIRASMLAAYEKGKEAGIVERMRRDSEIRKRERRRYGLDGETS